MFSELESRGTDSARRSHAQIALRHRENTCFRGAAVRSEHATGVQNPSRDLQVQRFLNLKVAGIARDLPETRASDPCIGKEGSASDLCILATSSTLGLKSRAST